jgi:hypothetical protein
MGGPRFPNPPDVSENPSQQSAPYCLYSGISQSKVFAFGGPPAGKNNLARGLVKRKRARIDDKRREKKERISLQIILSFN